MSKPPQPHAVCPICGKPRPDESAEKFRPFCSKRCADIDLGRWFSEQYRAPGPASEEPDEYPDQPA